MIVEMMGLDSRIAMYQSKMRICGRFRANVTKGDTCLTPLVLIGPGKAPLCR